MNAKETREYWFNVYTSPQCVSQDPDGLWTIGAYEKAADVVEALDETVFHNLWDGHDDLQEEYEEWARKAYNIKMALRDALKHRKIEFVERELKESD